jgi:hypothetical protein
VPKALRLQVLEHRFVRDGRQSRPPALDRNPEVQELVTARCGETSYAFVVEHHEAVDERVGDLPLPPDGDAVSREWVPVLRKHAGQRLHGAALLDIEHGGDVRRHHHPQHR